MTMPCLQRTLALVIAMPSCGRVVSARQRRHAVDTGKVIIVTPSLGGGFRSTPYQHATRSPLVWESCTVSDERPSELCVHETYPPRSTHRRTLPAHPETTP